MPTSCRDSSRPGSISGSMPAANWSQWRGPIAFRPSSASVPSATSSPTATTATAAWPRPQPRRSPRSSSASAVSTSCSTCATATRSPTAPTSGLASSTTAPSSKASSTAGPTDVDGENQVHPILWVYAANLGCACDLVHGEGIGGGAHRDLQLVGLRAHLLVCPRHDVVEALVDLALLPEELLQVLDPLEIGDRHAARVGQDVGDQEHAFVGEDVIGFGGGRTIGSLSHDPGSQLGGVVAGDGALQRRWDQD